MLREPVGKAQPTDLCRDLLAVAWLGDADGREVLGSGDGCQGEARGQGEGITTQGVWLTSGVMRLMVGRS